MPGQLRLEVVPALSASSLLLAFEGWNDAGEAASRRGALPGRSAGAARRSAHIDPELFHDFTVQRPEVRLDAGGVRQHRVAGLRLPLRRRAAAAASS